MVIIRANENSCHPRVCPAITTSNTRHQNFLVRYFVLSCALFVVGSVAAQSLYVGSNSSGQITNFTSGTNTYSATFVGFGTADANNLLTVDSFPAN